MDKAGKTSKYPYMVFLESNFIKWKQTATFSEMLVLKMVVKFYFIKNIVTLNLKTDQCCVFAGQKIY